jgi:transcriptional regulator with XRE-family HTH domain
LSDKLIQAKKSKSFRFTAARLAEINNALFSTKRWFADVGKPVYQLTSPSQLLVWCREHRLPPGWAALSFGYRFYLYHVLGAQFSQPPMSAGRQPILTQEELAYLRERHAQGLQTGELTRLSYLYGLSVSHLSRILRGERRVKTAPTYNLAALDQAAWDAQGLLTEEVEALAACLFTAPEWLAAFGEAHHLTQLQTLYSRCQGRELPVGWQSFRLVDCWTIYHETWRTRAELTKSG